MKFDDIKIGTTVELVHQLTTDDVKRFAELTGDVEFLHKLKQIPELTLKFVATNQSLYV